MTFYFGERGKGYEYHKTKGSGNSDDLPTRGSYNSA